MKNIGPLEREKIAQILDIKSRTQLTQVSKEWHDAVERSWGPAVYNLPYPHRQPVDAPDWKKACRLRDMAAHMRPEDIDDGCIEMALVAAQLDGRAGKASGERFILGNLVRLGSYADALRYLGVYPVAQAGNDAAMADVGPDAAVDFLARRAAAHEALDYLMQNARPSADLPALAVALLSCCGEAFRAALTARAAQAKNPALYVALSNGTTALTRDNVYAQMRNALLRRDLGGIKACLVPFDKLGRPALGPLLNAAGREGLDSAVLRALFAAGITGEPCTLDSSWSIRQAVQAAREEGEDLRAFFAGPKDASGATWMHHLLAKGRDDDWDLADILCAAGVSIFEPDLHGQSPLGVARNALFRNNCISELLKHAPAPWPLGFEELRTGRTDAAQVYWTQALQDMPSRAVELLRCAAWAGDAACVRLALQHAEAQADMVAAMTCAVGGEHWDVAEILLAHGADFASGLAIEHLSVAAVRSFVGSRVRFEVLFERVTEQQMRALCALHTAHAPLVDMNGTSMPVALLRAARLDVLKTLWRRGANRPLAAEELLKELLSLPTTGAFYQQQDLVMKLLKSYPTPLPPDTSFPVALLEKRLDADGDCLKLRGLKRLWRAHRPNGQAPTRVSVLACAAVIDLAAGDGNMLTRKFADRGFRLRPDEQPFFNAWLKQTLRREFLSSGELVLAEALVRGGMSSKPRDSQGRTLLHKCRYGDLFDALVAEGADAGAMDFKERVPQLPDRPTRALDNYLMQDG